MAILAGGQVLLGLPAMGRAWSVTTIDSVRCGAWSVGVAVGGDRVGIGVVRGKTAWNRRNVTDTRRRHAVAQSAAAVLGGQVDPAVTGGVSRVVIVAALPVGRVGTGVWMADRAVTNNRNPIEIKIVHDGRVGDKTTIDTIRRTTVAIQAGVLVNPPSHPMIDRVGEVNPLVGCRGRWVAAAIDMAGAVEATGTVATLQVGSMADCGGTAGPAQVSGKVLMIGDHIGPAGGVKLKWWAGNMTAEAADRVTVAVEIESVAALAAAQIGIGVGSVQGDPVGDVNIAARGGLRTAATTSGHQQKTEQGGKTDRILHHMLLSPWLAMTAGAGCRGFWIAVTTEA